MSFLNLASEEGIVCQKHLEINTCVLVEKHTSDSWSKFFSKGLLNKSINAVSNELRDLVTSEGLEWGDINLWQLDHWLIHLNLLWCSWLLLLHVHLLRIDISTLHWWLRHASHVHVASLLMHLISSWLIRIMLLIHVLILVVITSSLVVIATSTTVISLTSSSILVLLCSVIVVPVLLCATLVLVWNPHLIHWVVISVILSLKIDELQNILLSNSIILLLDVSL